MNRKNFLKSLFCLPALTLAKDAPIVAKDNIIIISQGKITLGNPNPSFVLDVNGNLGIGISTSSNFLKINKN